MHSTSAFPNRSSPFKWFPKKTKQPTIKSHLKKGCKQQRSLEFLSYPKQFPQKQFHKRVNRHYKSWMCNHRTATLCIAALRALISLSIWIRTKQPWTSTKNTTFNHDLRSLFPFFLDFSSFSERCCKNSTLKQNFGKSCC